MIRETGSIELARPIGCSRIIRTPSVIQKVKNRMKGIKRMSVRKLSSELDIFQTSIRRILKNDLGYHPYKKIIESLLTDAQKIERKKFANWVRTNFRKEQTMKILFSEEKLFDIDGVYNSQNASGEGAGHNTHTHHLTQQWCQDHFPAFIDEDHWPPNSPDLNPCDYCIWDELVGAINWNKVTLKKTLIEELKRAVKNFGTQLRTVLNASLLIISIREI
jgi:hypothetical protein